MPRVWWPPPERGRCCSGEAAGAPPLLQARADPAHLFWLVGAVRALLA